MGFVQQSLTGTNSKYNADFCENGWYAEPEVYDFSNIMTSVRSQFIMNNGRCPTDMNMMIEETIPTQKSIKIYKDGRVAMPAWTTEAAIIDDESAWGNILADLTADPSTGTCTDPTFSWAA